MPRNFIAGLCMLFAGLAGAADGLITKASRYPVAESVSRLGQIIKAGGSTVFATLDHGAAAEQAGLRMPPATVIVFGSPKGGTPMMLGAPTMAIDLPLKILVWEDAAGKAWVSYNTASYISARHSLKGMEKQVQGLDGLLDKITSSVVE